MIDSNDIGLCPSLNKIDVQILWMKLKCDWMVNEILH